MRLLLARLLGLPPMVARISSGLPCGVNSESAVTFGDAVDARGIGTAWYTGCIILEKGLTGLGHGARSALVTAR
jgi:hypothetical protein